MMAPTVYARVQDSVSRLPRLPFGKIVPMLMIALTGCGRVADSPGVTDASPPAPIVLVAGLSNPAALAVDGTDVYFTDSGSIGENRQDGWIGRCAKAGCGGAAMRLAIQQSWPLGIALDESRVFWVNSGDGLATSVATCAKESCTATLTVLADEAPNHLEGAIATDGHDVFWTRHDAIASCPNAGCAGAARRFAPAAVAFGGVLVDGANVYFTEALDVAHPDLSQHHGAIRVCARAGCADTPTIFARDLVDPRAIAADETTIYWVGGASDGIGATESAVQSCPKSGCASPTTIAPEAASGSIAVDRDYVYWTNKGDNARLLRCPKTGCGQSGPTVVAADQPFMWGVVVDDSGIYWLSASGFGTARVMKLPK
jgi:hypothetical protein